MTRYTSRPDPLAPAPVSYQDARKARRLVDAERMMPGSVPTHLLNAANAALAKRGAWLSARQRASPNYRPARRRTPQTALERACAHVLQAMPVILQTAVSARVTPAEAALAASTRDKLRAMLTEDVLTGEDWL